jgi:hypothetical protein
MPENIIDKMKMLLRTQAEMNIDKMIEDKMTVAN